MTEKEAGREIKTYLYSELHLSTRILKRLKYQCDGRGILINGSPVTVRHRLSRGEVLTLALEDRVSSENIPPVPIPLSVLYEDEDLIVVNKPPAMPTHPTHGHMEDTVANALAAYYEGQGRPFVFRCGSRLDRDTSGVLPVCKNQACANAFFRYHREGVIDKQYDVIVKGTPHPEKGVIDLPIRRMENSVIMRIAGDGGAPSKTAYETVRTVKDPHLCEISLVRAKLYTGRTHQIRVHFSAIGCAVVGDTLYGGEEMKVFPRQAVHCARLSFPHPKSGEMMCFQAPLPADLRDVMGDNVEKEANKSI